MKIEKDDTLLTITDTVKEEKGFVGTELFKITAENELIVYLDPVMKFVEKQRKQIEEIKEK